MNRKARMIVSILWSLLILSGFLYAQSNGKINIAVLNLEAPDLAASAQRALSDRLRTELFNTGRFAVMERNKMEEILKEKGFQQTGCTNE